MTRSMFAQTGGLLTWPMAKRLQLFGITYLVGKINFQGPGRLSE